VRALAELGVHVVAEVRGRAAFVTAVDAESAIQLASPSVRRRSVGAARLLGFTHVALVLEDG
jgi:hypothetical protein